MRHRYYSYLDFWFDLFEWLLADKESRNFLRYVPKSCRICELLGICRDESSHWKCHHGYMVLNAQRRRKERE